MSRLVQAAVLLPCWVLFLLFARDRIVEALNRRHDGRSWPCLDRRDGLPCDCCGVAS